MRTLLFGIFWLGLALLPSMSQAASTVKTGTLAGLHKPIRNQDLAVRISKKSGDYTESWILWAWNDEGYAVYAILAITRIVLGTRFAVMLSVRKPDGKVIHQMAEYKQRYLRYSKKGLSIQVTTKHSIAGNPSQGRVRIGFPKAGCDFRFKRTLKGFRAQGGHIRFGSREFRGYTYAPRAKIQGTLRIGGKKLAFKGMGYLDHSWQDIPPPKMARRWYGARAYNKDYTVIATQLQTTTRWKPQSIPSFSIAKGPKWIYHGIHGQVRYRQGNITVDKVTSYKTPKLTKFIGKMKDGTKVTLTFRHRKRLDRFDVLSHIHVVLRFIVQKLITKPFLFRYKADATLTFEKGSKKETHKLKGYTEWAFFNP